MTRRVPWFVWAVLGIAMSLLPLHAQAKHTSASTTNPDGTTTTITKNADGTTTRTVSGPDGQVISRAPVEPEPPTTVPPRPPGSSASTTDADGNTITVEMRPDGTRVRTVTAPDGTVLKTEPLTPPPTGAQLLYDTVTKNDVTVNTAMALTVDEAKTILEVSVLPTGKGEHLRTWVVEKVALLLGKDKLKPVATSPYYVEKESAVAGLAPVLFGAIAAEYVRSAQKAAASKGKACSHASESSAEERREPGKFRRGIEQTGMVAGLSLLGSQAKGQIEGRRLTFDLTGRERRLPGSRLQIQTVNTNPGRLNIANTPNELIFLVAANVTVDEDLLVMVRPHIVRGSDLEE